MLCVCVCLLSVDPIIKCDNGQSGCLLRLMSGIPLRGIRIHINPTLVDQPLLCISVTEIQVVLETQDALYC